jgi:hypothetical protein
MLGEEIVHVRPPELQKTLHKTRHKDPFTPRCCGLLRVLQRDSGPIQIANPALYGSRSGEALTAHLARAARAVAGMGGPAVGRILSEQETAQLVMS